MQLDQEIEFFFNVPTRQNCLGFSMGKKRAINLKTRFENLADAVFYFSKKGYRAETSAGPAFGRTGLILYSDGDGFSHVSRESRRFPEKHMHKFGQGPLLRADPKWVSSEFPFGFPFAIFSKEKV